MVKHTTGVSSIRWGLFTKNRPRRKPKRVPIKKGCR